MAGTLYCISTGPGDGELLTLRAMHILKRCQIIAAPKVPGRKVHALSIVGSAVDLRDKPILCMEFPMGHCNEAYDSAAEALCRALLSGDMALLCLGDASLYASASHLYSRVKRRGFKVEIVPGVTSFCAMAAVSGTPLAMGDMPLQILPYGCQDFADRLRLPGAKVIMKAGGHMTELCDLLEELGLLDKAYAAENVGMADERFYPDIRHIGSCGYFTTVYISG